jgi:drug/metabolite transporter (DMT)-like permease
MEVLFFYTLFAFLFVCPDVKNAAQMDMHFLPAVAFKSFIIFLAWMCSFKAIKKMPISLYGLLDLSRVLFATLLAVIVQHEVLSGNQMIGLLLVCVGLLMLKRPKWPMVCRMQKKVRENSDIQTDSGTACTISEKQKIKEQQNEEHVPVILVLFALASCMLNAISGLLDKILTKDITSAQLQFWYMLFLVLYYLVYIIIAKDPREGVIEKPLDLAACHFVCHCRPVAFSGKCKPGKPDQYYDTDQAIRLYCDDPCG